MSGGFDGDGGMTQEAEGVHGKPHV
jgi:hypothetical protein